MKGMKIDNLSNVTTGKRLSDVEDKEVFELFDAITKNILRAQELLGGSIYDVLFTCSCAARVKFGIGRLKEKKKR